MDGVIMNCANCGKRIVKVGGVLGGVGKWVHQNLPDPESNSWDELVYKFCKISVAEPIIEVIDTPLDKAKCYFDKLDYPAATKNHIRNYLKKHDPNIFNMLDRTEER